MQYVLLTGGAGFIGSHMMDILVESGYRAIIIDDMSTGSLKNIRHQSANIFVEFYPGSVNDNAHLEEHMDNVEYIVHLAALPSVTRSIENPARTHEVNVDGTLNVLELARKHKVKKVVFASSSSVYGNTLTLPKHEGMVPSPLSPYAASKAAGENYMTAYCAAYGLPTVSLRYFNVYGPRASANSEYGAVIPKFIKAIKEGTAPCIYGDGTQTRDFTFVKDVAKATLLAMQSDVTGVFNIGTGQSVSLNELAGTMLELMCRQDLKPEYTDPRTGDVAHSLADITRAREAFGWEPAYTLEQGLKDTIDAY